MDDDWSLKDKDDKEDGCGSFIYYKSDIDILRKKLIEDILEESNLWWDYHIPKFQEERNESLINKINKRFGVEE
jgi:hypothetical protein